jgi:hypothetical protein
MRPPAAGKEGSRMLPLVVIAGMFLADLARPVTQAEYAQVMFQKVAWHELLSDEARANYLASGARVLAGFLHPGMTEESAPSGDNEGYSSLGKAVAILGGYQFSIRWIPSLQVGHEPATNRSWAGRLVNHLDTAPNK